MPELITTDILAEHTSWACNSPLPNDPDVICSAGNDITYDINCKNCGAPKQPGAEALDDDGEKIGEYLGNDQWKYYSGP
ncbi:Fc.00g058260.m01.CDS01 [Cosmosporella sp. VM-42]